MKTEKSVKIVNTETTEKREKIARTGESEKTDKSENLYKHIEFHH